MNIVITGVSRGIGFHLAKEFLKDSEHKVYGISRDTKKMEDLKNESSGNFMSIGCDITDNNSLKTAAYEIEKTSDGKLDILINNAGLLINKSFTELTNENWKEIYDVNVFGLVGIIKMLLPQLKNGLLNPAEKIKSHIVNISSMGGVQGSMKFNGLSAYSSSKGALITIGECIAQELNPMGIRVNTIALGSVETEMFATAFPGMKAATTPGDIALWIKEFAITGFRFFNGKVMMMSTNTP
jgi:3-oxoacyl-[acyl-carrier protein] reductase